jgi:hypothetical protein
MRGSSAWRLASGTSDGTNGMKPMPERFAGNAIKVTSGCLSSRPPLQCCHRTYVSYGSFSSDSAGFACWRMSASLRKRPKCCIAVKWRDVPKTNFTWLNSRRIAHTMASSEGFVDASNYRAWPRRLLSRRGRRSASAARAQLHRVKRTMARTIQADVRALSPRRA